MESSSSIVVRDRAINVLLYAVVKGVIGSKYAYVRVNRRLVSSVTGATLARLSVMSPRHVKLTRSLPITYNSTKAQMSKNLPYSHSALPDSGTEEYCPLNQKTILTKSITSQES